MVNLRFTNALSPLPLCLILLLVISPTFAIQAYGGFKVLWIYDVPFTPSNPEFMLVRNLISGLGGSITYKNAWEIWCLRDFDWSSWVRSAGYDLVVIVWGRSAYWGAIKAFLSDCIVAGVPVLLVPGRGWNVTEGLGLVMVGAEAFNTNFSVAHHVVTEGVWVAGVSGGVGVVSLFYRVNSSVGGVSWEPVILEPNDGAVVVVGVVNGTRVAAVAPYFYAYGGLDNRVLLENVLLWLLGREDEITKRLGSSKVVSWGSVGVKDLKELRDRLVSELSKLEKERNSTLAELEVLKSNLTNLRVEYDRLKEEYRSLRSQYIELKGRVESLASAKVELEKVPEIIRGTYRALGVGISVGLVAGFLITWFLLLRRRSRGGE